MINTKTQLSISSIEPNDKIWFFTYAEKHGISKAELFHKAIELLKKYSKEDNDKI